MRHFGMRSLGQLQKGEKARIVSVRHNNHFTRRLLEMGLLEGACVEVVHESPFGRDPVAIRVRGTLLALRRKEADLIEVTNV